MGFRLIPKSVTLNDRERCNDRYFGTQNSFRGALHKMVEDILKLSATEMLPKLLVLAIPYDDMMSGTPPLRGLNARGVDKCSDFRPIEGYISETVQDRR